MARSNASQTTSRQRGGTAKKQAPAKRTTVKRAAAKRTTAKRAAAKRTTAARSRNSSGSSTRDVQRQAKQAAAGVQDQARATTLDQLSARSNQAGDQLSSVVSDVREIATQLRSQDNDSAARLAGAAADRAEQVADYLSNSSAEKLLADIEDFAQSRPWLVAAGAVLAGFVGARALSSSSRRRHGGSAVDLDAGSDFDESDAESDYDDE